MIAIVNYGVGNLASVYNMLRKAGADAVITNEPEQILSATKLILPGVGHYDHAMRMLNDSGLREVLNEAVLNIGSPVLGICLGAQLLGKGSEEGVLPGLGWIDMVCRRIPSSNEIRVPHMGWNEILQLRESPIFRFAEGDARYYFTHSYYMECENSADTVALASHGIEFTCVVQRANIYGTQFHPEKSLKHGLAVLKAFDALNQYE